MQKKLLNSNIKGMGRKKYFGLIKILFLILSLFFFNITCGEPIVIINNRTIYPPGPKVQGDFNGDGFVDILIGAYKDDDSDTDSGCAFIFYGGNNLPSTIDAGDADVKFVGDASGDHFGISVSCAGDINADGVDDVIVGAYSDDDGGDGSGAAFIFYGRNNLSSTIDAGDADIKLVGEDTGDRFGYSVSYAGDVNADGIDDVIVGAYFDNDGGDVSGCAFIFYGGNNLPSTIDAGDADVKFIGEDAGDQFGYSVSYAGDVNVDGIDDVIIGAILDDDGGDGSGCAFIFYGNSYLPSIIDASLAKVKLVGDDAGDRFGISVSYAGDINADGVDDVIVGAHYDADGGASSGCAFVFYGRSYLPSTIGAGEADIKFIGENPGDNFGNYVSYAGDVNADGVDDVIVGADYYEGGGSGAAFIFYGNPYLASSIDASKADVKFVGGDAGDRFGDSLFNSVDINNDGYSDVIVGAHYDDDGGIDSGCAFVFYGADNLPLIIDANEANIKLVGESAGDRFGLNR